MNITAGQRRTHLAWLKEITNILTAAGKEQRVIAYVRSWTKQRRNIDLTEDPVGNLVLSLRRGSGAKRGKPLAIVAHMDHPAFVIREVCSPRQVVAEFRGGVRPPYFDDAQATFLDASDRQVNARATEVKKPRKGGSLFYRLTFELPRRADLQVGDIGRWRMPPQRITKGLLHTPACDNLASVAAALCMLDVLAGVRNKKDLADVRVLLTRSEEIGFVGAIGACKHHTLPANARVIVLETSRSFPESPIGAGPIVRVGDRLSTFDPDLTGAIADVAEHIAQKKRSFAYQRKLMTGGMCEATCFCSYGYTSTCVCLPLGNYHNQVDVENVERGTNRKPAKAGLEYISVSDFNSYVELLAALPESLTHAPRMRQRMEAIFKERRYVLRDQIR